MVNWLNIVRVEDVFTAIDEEALSFEEGRDEVARRLRDQVVARRDEEFDHLVSELAAAPDVDEFDDALDALWDWGDVDHRLWLQTF